MLQFDDIVYAVHTQVGRDERKLDGFLSSLPGGTGIQMMPLRSSVATSNDINTTNAIPSLSSESGTARTTTSGTVGVSDVVLVDALSDPSLLVQMHFDRELEQ
jgi:hypothetical protein